jgi:16S rRNA (cytosine967-C5)-methyltransferase
VSAEKPREIAARLLRRHAQGSGWLESLLDEALREGALTPADRGLLQELTFGVVRWQATLDWLIDRKTAGRTQKIGLQILLRLGLYQIFWLDRVPDHAAVNETVSLAKGLGFGPQSGFVNAVLRGCLRERDKLKRELQELKTREPHLGYSHPRWLCEQWEKRWGPDNLRALLEWNNASPSVFARINMLKTTPEKLAAQFEHEGVRFVPRPFAWVPANLIFELNSHPPLATLPSFQQGLFYVQDPSTLLAARELNPQPGETILDWCAAPGGKTTYLAQLMQNQGLLLAQDAEASRCELIRQNCARLGVTCVQISQTVPDGNVETPGLFDRVLVDAPCSNTGVMRRRVELRWRVKPAEIARLQRLQLSLMRRAATFLKPAGTLVYSTCSLEPEENAGVTKAFLSDAKGFRLESQRELIPFQDGVDGAYVARLTRD